MSVINVINAYLDDFFSGACNISYTSDLNQRTSGEALLLNSMLVVASVHHHMLLMHKCVLNLFANVYVSRCHSLGLLGLFPESAMKNTFV